MSGGKTQSGRLSLRDGLLVLAQPDGKSEDVYVRASATKEELKPFLEGEIPPVVEQMADATGTDVAGYVSQGPGLSAYALEDGIVYRTYVTTARGLEPAMAYYGLLDRTAHGRGEEGELEHWLRRHDEY